MIKLGVKILMLLCMLGTRISACAEMTIMDNQSYIQLSCIHMPSIHVAKKGVITLNVPMSATNQTLLQFILEALLAQGKVSSTAVRIHMSLYTRDLNSTIRALTMHEKNVFWLRVADRDKKMGQVKELSRLPLSFSDILRPFFLILHVDETFSKL